MQVAMNKSSLHMQKFFLRNGWEGQCPQLKFFQASGIVQRSQTKKLIFGPQIWRYPLDGIGGRIAPTINFSTQCLSLKSFEQEVRIHDGG